MKCEKTDLAVQIAVELAAPQLTDVCRDPDLGSEGESLWATELSSVGLCCQNRAEHQTATVSTWSRPSAMQMY